MSEMEAAARRLEARVGKRFVEVLREFVAWERDRTLPAGSARCSAPRTIAACYVGSPEL